MKAIITAWGALLLAACASVTEPTSVGRDTYITAAHVDFQPGSSAKARQMAIDKATSHCKRLSKRMEAVDLKHHDKGGLDVVYEVTFKCLPE